MSRLVSRWLKSRISNGALQMLTPWTATTAKSARTSLHVNGTCGVFMWRLCPRLTLLLVRHQSKCACAADSSCGYTTAHTRRRGVRCVGPLLTCSVALYVWLALACGLSGGAKAMPTAMATGMRAAVCRAASRSCVRTRCNPALIAALGAVRARRLPTPAARTSAGLCVSVCVSVCVCVCVCVFLCVNVAHVVQRGYRSSVTAPAQRSAQQD